MVTVLTGFCWAAFGESAGAGTAFVCGGSGGAVDDDVIVITGGVFIDPLPMDASFCGADGWDCSRGLLIGVIYSSECRSSSMPI